MTARFASHVADMAGRNLVIGIRAGAGDHKFTAVWAVVVKGRIYARSWRLSPDGWNARLSQDPQAAIKVGDEELPAIAIRVHDEPVNAAVDAAYRAKYHTPASAQYVADLTSGASRESTVEFAPRQPRPPDKTNMSEKHAPRAT